METPITTQSFNPETATGVHRWYTDLHKIYTGITGHFNLRTFAEVGFGPANIALAFQFRKYAKKLLLVEPNHELYQQGVELLPDADWHNVAIDATKGKRPLVLNNGSSYLQHTHFAPTPIGSKNNRRLAMGMPKQTAKTQEVFTVTFDFLDDGEIDCLNLDCEGHEWIVLQQMKSTPKVIMIELWSSNPNLKDISNWLCQNNYKCLFTTGVQGETQVWYFNYRYTHTTA